MATKKTNAKIKELKGIKPEKITVEQLEKVQKAVSDINRVQIEVGSLEIKKHEMIHGMGQLRETLGELQDELQEEYGTIDVNINNGEINYEKDVEADTKD